MNAIIFGRSAGSSGELCRSCPNHRSALRLFIGLCACAVMLHAGRAQTTLLNETFEGIFPTGNGWTATDSNANTGLVVWDDVNTSYGSVPAHGGSWKGYCAGLSNGVFNGSATYANNMSNFMTKALNFAGFTGANLEFWYAIPSIEGGNFDHFRAHMDSTVLFDRSTVQAGWTHVTVPLNSFLGGSHTLKFEFYADVSNTAEGAYIDDISVRGANVPFIASQFVISNANYSGYVLDSDTTLGRSNIQGRVTFNVENFTGTAASYTNVLSYRLINASNGAPHPIFDLGNANTNASYTYNITNVLALAAGTNVFVTNTAFIRPAAWMNQFVQYYVECRVLTNGALAQTLATAPTNFYHFTNTVSGDASFNVLANMTGDTWSRTYAVQTIPGLNSFQVTANYQLRRWDDFSAGVATTNIPVVLNYTLRDNGGNLIALTSNSQTFFEPVDNHQFLFPFNYPDLVANSRILDIRPAVQLDSVTKTYYLTVTIAHTNNPSSGQVLTANTRTTTTNELLHFNGNLLFSTIGTRMTALAFAPPVNPPGGGVIPTILTGVNGFVTLQTNHTYSGAGPLGVNLLPNGDAVVTAGAAVISGPADDSVARVRFTRGPLVLTSSGVSADVKVTLPTGFGYRTNNTSSQVIFSMIQFTSVPLNGSLDPASDLTYAPGVTIYAAEESKPAWLVCDKITWHIASGTFDLNPVAASSAVYVRADEFAYLASVSNTLVNPAAMGDKKSNDKYWLFLKGVSSPPVIQTSSGSNSLLATTFDFNSGGFRTHFPYNSSVNWAGGGAMQVKDDLVVQGTVSTLNTPGVLRVPYTRDCPDCGGGGSGSVAPALTSSNGLLNFTRDGGLVAGGTTPVVNLQWGYINDPSVLDFAQQALQFTEAAFHMPGAFLRGDQNLLPRPHGPTTILYSGFAVSNLNVIERPLSAGYSAGLADYAGMNFRALADNAHNARSTIAGKTNINWKLDYRSKYYIRPGGVSGIHEAVPGSFPSTLTLWGYTFNFDSYGLSYLDSQNVDSRTDGNIPLPSPAHFTNEFENMKFSCLGAPLKADLPFVNPFKMMEYWVADFKTHSLQFKTKNGCSPTEGYLVLGIESYASHLDKPMFGYVGFFSSGDQIPRSFNLQGVDSRLKAPNVFKFSGANNSTYSFVPVADAFYNTWSNRPPTNGPAGWMNLFGTVDVPFFDDLQLHLQTSCRTNGVAASNAPIYLAGGWPRAGSMNANHGWRDAFNHSPFETNFFDWKNAGWPGSGGGLTIDRYRDNNVETYHPRAQRLWLGVVDFDYPLSWNSSLRSFKSFHEETNDFFILKVQHQVKYMDGKQAEIDFGAQYDGLPSISIANIAFNAIDEATGVGQALVQAATQPVHDILNAGLDELNQLLDTQMKRLMDGVFDRTVDPIIDNWYGALSNQWAMTWNALPLSQKQMFVSSVLTNATNFFIGSVGGPAQNLTKALKDVGSAVNEANNLIKQVETYLRDVTNAICAVAGTLDRATNGVPIPPVDGLLKKVGGNFPVLGSLGQSLVGQLAPQLLDAVAQPGLNNLIKELEPGLTQITEALNQVKAAVMLVESQLHSAGEFTTEIDNTIKGLSMEMSNVSVHVSMDVGQFFGQLNYSVDNPFTHVSAADVKKFVRQKIEDEFFATTAASQVQTILRQRLYDLDAAMREQIDSVFQELNGLMRNLISQSLAELDNSINKSLGDISDVIGAGKINGHALIDGDSLKCLRIDAHFEWKAPDAMEFDAFLQIKELDSDGNNGCVSSNAPYTEVTLGCNHVPFDWISPDLEANIQAKFTFDGTAPFPVNLAGQLELIGDLSFETFVLHDLAAALAFGKYENYVALKGGVRFNGYDFSGAIFFGRTCTIDPLKLIDPDVASVLGDPPFTGAYVYAQGWLPVSELVLGIPASCLFEISAGVGAGAFYFAEGPTYGGKMFLGVSGELLCIVSIEGDITLIGLKSGDDLRFKGHGHFEAEIGPCPFCISVGKDVDVSYIKKSWKID